MGIAVVTVGAHAATFRVGNANDGGTGSLRWAIEQANATPGLDTITGSGVIHLSSSLPPITDPVDLVASVTIDGSGAPGADGLILRASDSQIEYVAVKNFGGDGIVVAGNRNEIRSVTVTNVRSGVVISGNDNTLLGAEFSRTRENGIWVTSTGSGNVLGRAMGEVIMCPAVPNGINIYGNGTGVRIDGRANTLDGTLIEANGDGILVTAAGNTITNCSFKGNTGNGVTLLAPATFSRNIGGCNAGSFVNGALVAPPTIAFASADVDAGTVSGVFHGDPYRVYTLQFLSDVPSATCPQGLLDFVGMKTITTDGMGNAAYTSVFEPPTTAIAAIAVGADGQVSRLSERAAVTATGENRADLMLTMTGQSSTLLGREVIYTIRVTNNGPAAINGAFVRIAPTPGAITVGSVAGPHVSYCQTNSGGAYCGVGPLAAGDSATIFHTVKVWLGTVTLRANAGLNDTQRMVDPNASNDAASANLSVIDGPPAGRRRASGH
jgi:hypothetical protein